MILERTPPRRLSEAASRRLPAARTDAPSASTRVTTRAPAGTTTRGPPGRVSPASAHLPLPHVRPGQRSAPGAILGRRAGVKTARTPPSPSSSVYSSPSSSFPRPIALSCETEYQHTARLAQSEPRCEGLVVVVVVAPSLSPSPDLRRHQASSPSSSPASLPPAFFGCSARPAPTAAATGPWAAAAAKTVPLASDSRAVLKRRFFREPLLALARARTMGSTWKCRASGSISATSSPYVPCDQ